LNCTRKWQFFGAQLFNVQIVNQRPSPAPPTSEFEASSSGSSTSLVWLAVNEDGVSLLDQHSMQLLARYSYDNVVTFGGCQDDFMLVVTSESASSLHSLDGSGQPQTQQPNVNKPTHRGNHSDRASSEDSLGTTKLLFNAGKPQILQITLLMADYMNMIGKTAPGTLSTSATPVATPKNHHRIKPEAVGGSRGGGFESRGCTSRSSSRARGQLLTAPNTPRPDHKELTPRLSGVISSTGHKS